MNILDLLYEHKIDVKKPGEHHHATFGWASIDCPHCSPNWKKYRLGFEIDTGRCNCWGCGPKNVVAILSEICGIHASEVMSALRHLRAPKPFLDKHRHNLKTPDGISDLLPQHENYLRSRGFDPDEISKIWGIKGIGLASKCQWRIYIPILDEYGRQVSWTTRSIGNHPLKYISAKASEEAVSLKEVLYGAHLARNAVVVVEGPTDAWAVGPGAVATCGVVVTAAQLAAISFYPLRVICLDRDAEDRAEKLFRDLGDCPGTTEVVCLTTGEDAAEADPEEIKELRTRYLDIA
jgi:hypothetical protein